MTSNIDLLFQRMELIYDKYVRSAGGKEDTNFIGMALKINEGVGPNFIWEEGAIEVLYKDFVDTDENFMTLNAIASELQWRSGMTGDQWHKEVLWSLAESLCVLPGGSDLGFYGPIRSIPNPETIYKFLTGNRWLFAVVMISMVPVGPACARRRGGK